MPGSATTAGTGTTSYPNPASPTKRKTRSAFKTPPDKLIKPTGTAPGAPQRPTRKIVL